MSGTGGDIGTDGGGQLTDLERNLASIRRPLEEATTLPGRFYHDPIIYQAELKRIFGTMWLCVGREEDVADAGDFLTRAVGAESVMLIRGAEGSLRAFHNVCRHRGSRILTEASGKGLTRLQCPYHAWTYELHGELRVAPHMEGAQGFDKRQYSLHPVRLERWDGFLFVNLSSEGPTLLDHLGEMGTKFERYRMGTLRRAGRIAYTVAANWKLLCENYSECYHCALIHPELNRVSHYLSGCADLSNAAAVGGWMDLRKEDYSTMTLTGRSRRPPFASIDPEDHRRIHYYIVYPNLLLSLHPDYVMTHTIWPEGPGRSQILCEFLFDPEVAARADFDPSDAVQFWDLTNRQDWRACELAHQGVGSTAYERGRLSDLEWMVHIFDNFYADRLTGRTAPVPIAGAR